MLISWNGQTEIKVAQWVQVENLKGGVVLQLQIVYLSVLHLILLLGCVVKPFDIFEEHGDRHWDQVLNCERSRDGQISQ